MDTRETITKELLAGATPYRLSKKYPRASVYRIYNELIQAGQLSQAGPIVVDSENPPAAVEEAEALPVTTKVKARVPATGAEVVTLPGEKALPADAVNRIRGILGLTLRPKVLSCPMPELLYPAMVIAVTELGFEPMRPDDFIDTVLYQWLEACDYIPNVYMKKSELEQFAKSYGITEEAIKEYTEKHGLMTLEEFAEKYGISLPPPPEEVAEVEKEETEVEDITAREVTNEPHKPTTVGDLLSRLHISNIQKEVEKENGSSRRTEPSGSQGNNEPGE